MCRPSPITTVGSNDEASLKPKAPSRLTPRRIHSAAAMVGNAWRRYQNRSQPPNISTLSHQIVQDLDSNGVISVSLEDLGYQSNAAFVVAMRAAVQVPEPKRSGGQHYVTG